MDFADTSPVALILSLVIGYLSGSVPYGLLLTQMAGLGDVRQIGSGNIGATNVLRTGNKGLAALTLLISAVFRRGGDVSFVVEELKAVFDPRGGHWVQGHYVPSILAAIGEVIEQHLHAIGFLKDPDTLEMDFGDKKKAIAVNDGPVAGGPVPNQCPSCASVSLMKQEGCDLCTSCGYSKCG